MKKKIDQQKYEILNIDYTMYKTIIPDKFKNKQKWEIPDNRKIRAFIPGTILKITVKEGQSVKAGTKLCILDAMKMKNKLKSPLSGKIKSIHVNKGDKVPKGILLIELE